MNVHNPLAGNCRIPHASKTGLAQCLLCVRPAGQAASMRAVKVVGGKIVHAIGDHGEARSPHTTAVGVDAPDGTYLRLDYVQDVLVRHGSIADAVEEIGRAVL